MFSFSNICYIHLQGGAGFIGSHAALRLLEEGNRVTIIDNLSRGNLGAIEVLQENAREKYAIANRHLTMCSVSTFPPSFMTEMQQILCRVL